MGLSILEARRRSIITSQPHLETQSGSLLTLDKCTKAPLKSCLLTFGPVQEGTGDPSPSNVRPISGRTGVTVHRAGKNLFDVATPISRSQYVNGAIEPINNARIMTDYIPVKNGVTYTMSIDPTTDNLAFINYNLFDENKNWLCDRTGNGESASFSGHTEHSFTVNYSGASYIRIVVRDKTSSSTLIDNKTLANSYLQLELGSTATPYEPYTGQTVDVQFPSEAGTVYGGTLDVTTGELVVDRAMVDLGTLTWKNDSNRPTVKYSSSLNNLIFKKSPWANALCSGYALYKNGPDALSSRQFSTTNAYGAGNILFKDEAFDGKTEAEVKEYLTGVQLVYELADPIIYQLTPQQIRTIAGTNNVWSDADTITASAWTY